MTGPWADYGRPSGSEPGLVPGRNPYLRDEESLDESGSGTYQPPSAGNPYRSTPYPAPAEAVNPYLSRPDVPNPYVRDFSVPPSSYAMSDPYARDPYAGQWSPPNASGQHRSGRPQVLAGGYRSDSAHPRPAGRDWSLVVAVVVMVIIVGAAVAILFDHSNLPTAAPPPGDAPAANSPTTVRGQPAPSTGSAPTPTKSAVAHRATTGPVPAKTTTTKSDADLSAAKAAATAWVAAINRQQVTAAQALSCSAVKSKITASFVKSVAGSIIITSVTIDEPAAARPTATLEFTYQKTTDAKRLQDRLALIVESGRWTVCN